MRLFLLEGLCGARAARLFVSLAAAAAVSAGAVAIAEPLQFSINDADVKNAFFRDGPAAAHVVLTSGTTPRLVVAFPAGNSGLALFLAADNAVTWGDPENLRGLRRPVEGGVLNGVEFNVSLSSPARIKNVLIGDIRTIRLFVDAQIAPPEETRAAAAINGPTVAWSRRRIDGRPGYQLSIEVTNGNLRAAGGGDVALETVNDAPIKLHIVALTGDKPLTPIPVDRLIRTSADDTASLQTLAFLSYGEKLLAGSWRFLTYFGRDTLLTLKLLSRSASPDLIEAGLSSVLDRLNDDGEVAHEEAIGEFAVLSHEKDGEAPSDKPIFDYKMIDDDFMLAPALADYLIDDPAGRARAADFLAKKSASGESYGALVVKNLRFVVNRTSAFAHHPAVKNLVSLKPGEVAGDWRDSEEGLGGGRYPFDVNAALVPAALEAAARLLESSLLSPYLTDEERGLASAGEAAKIWRNEAPQFFIVALGRDEATRRITKYAREIGAPAAKAETAPNQSFEFYALALDAKGRPIQVLHSDIAFSLAFGTPDAKTLRRMIDSIDQVFPAGLFTSAGMLVANPAFVESKLLRSSFDKTHYHGAVIWSWQQALMAYGIGRQLRRNDLDDVTRAHLDRAKQHIWSAICATRTTRLSELWSWSYGDDEYRVKPFGQSGDATESNAAQLWSTVYLGVEGLESCP